MAKSHSLTTTRSAQACQSGKKAERGNRNYSFPSRGMHDASLVFCIGISRFRQTNILFPRMSTDNRGLSFLADFYWNNIAVVLNAECHAERTFFRLQKFINRLALAIDSFCQELSKAWKNIFNKVIKIFQQSENPIWIYPNCSTSPSVLEYLQRSSGL